MINLTKNQQMMSNPNLIVFEGGSYNEDDLVLVCDINNPNLPLYKYQAFYISNGYNYGEEITEKKFKIGSYIDPSIIDYDILGFHKKRTIIFGELTKVEYYEFYDGHTYSNLILDETREYIRDSNGLVQYRNQSSRWYLSDNSIGLIKNTVKYYTLEESIQEGIDRRTNIISKAKSYVLINIGQLYSFDLLTSVKSEISLFIDGYTQPLRDVIANSTKPYLNQAIKDGIIESLRLN